MPWITINVLKGHSDEQKERLHQQIAKAACDSLEIPPEWVRIQITEMEDKDHSIGGIPMDKFEG